jgi:hypothetical protein
MRNASPKPARTELTCAHCGRKIVTAIQGLFNNPPVGSPRRFCSGACRQAAWRRRRAGVDETAPLQLTGGRSRRLAPTAHPDHGRDHDHHHDHKPLPSGQEVIAGTPDHTDI